MTMTEVACQVFMGFNLNPTQSTTLAQQKLWKSRNTFHRQQTAELPDLKLRCCMAQFWAATSDVQSVNGQETGLSLEGLHCCSQWYLTHCPTALHAADNLRGGWFPDHYWIIHLYIECLITKLGRFYSVPSTGQARKHDSHNSPCLVKVCTSSLRQTDNGVLH